MLAGVQNFQTVLLQFAEVFPAGIRNIVPKTDIGFRELPAQVDFLSFRPDRRKID